MGMGRQIAIIGGGVTGLSAAYHAAREGATVRLFEAADRVGGPVHSERDGDWLVEAGPNSLQVASSELSGLLHDLGLAADLCPASPAAQHRYILRNGRPQAAPTSPPGLLTSGLFSLGAKVRVLTEVLKRPRGRSADISLADFVRSHFGDELVDYGLNPFVAGIYAGNPEKLSAQHAFPSLWQMERTTGSIIRGQIQAAKARQARGETSGPPQIISFREGLGMLPAALAAKLPAHAIELGSRVVSLLPGKRWSLVWSRHGETYTESFDRIILALPAGALSRLAIGPLGERPLAELADIEYPAVASLFLGYRREQVGHPLNGFGMLVPTVEHRQVLGVLFSSSLFAGRAPAGHVALTVMLGGSQRPDLGTAALERLRPLVQRELGELLGVSGDPVYARLHAWPRAIPQYNLGYGRYLKAMEACEHQHPGLLIGGQVRDGIALAACLQSGRKLAARAARA